MNDLKSYVIRIIIVASIVQFGTIAIGQKYKKIYSFIGSVFIIFTMLSIPNVDVGSFFNFKYNELQSDNITVSERFTTEVSRKIQEEIHNVFGIDSTVDVLTDNEFSKIKIVVKCSCSDEVLYRIEEYVLKTFCTQKDEVIVVSE